MQKLTALAISLFISILLQAQVSNTVNVTAGGLYAALTPIELSATTSLTVNGTVDSRDFKTMRDNMPSLTSLDIRNLTIASYTGTLGTDGSYNALYPGNEIPRSAFRSKGITSVMLPSSIASIGNSAFTNCASLQNILIPATVTSVGVQAFYGCKALISISLPATVQVIGSNAFMNCTGLKSILLEWQTPLDLYPAISVFAYVSTIACSLYVPYGSAAEYAKTDQWKDFSTIVENKGFRLSSSTIFMTNSAGYESLVDIKSNTAWSAVSNQNWLKVNPGSGSGTATLKLTAEANLTGTARTATVTISSPEAKHQLITVTQQSIIASVTTTLVTCFGGNDGSITFSNPAGAANYEYSVNNGINWQAGNLFTGLPANDYSVWIRSSGNPASKCPLGVVTISELKQLTAEIFVPPVKCFEIAAQIMPGNPHGGSGSYEYSLDGNNWQSVVLFYSPYNIYGQNLLMRDAIYKQCIVSFPLPFTILEPLWVDAVVTQIDLTIKQKGSIVLNPNGGPFNYRYQWSNGATTKDIYNLDPGDYSVAVYADFGCNTNRSFTIDQPRNSPPILGSITGPAAVCQGQNSVVYSVTAVTGATFYLWTLPTGATGTSTTNSITVNYGSSAVSGNITVKGHNSYGDGPPSTLAVSVNSPPAGSGTITGTATVCQGQNSVVYSVLSVARATSYLWTLPSGASGTSTTNSITVNYGSSAVSGNITVKSHNNCGDGLVSTLPVSVNPIPDTPVISLNGKVLHSDAVSGNQWYNSANPIPGATAQDYTITSVGDYSVKVTRNGCSSAPSNIIKDVITSIESEEYDTRIKVYPNPVSDDLNIQYEGNLTEINYEIYSSSGQLVTSGVLLVSAVVHTSLFSSGLYTIKFTDGKKFEFRKVIRQN